jgi:2-desacetyl-2-hydroxyethyl bacteriochlorophyllide A dehydrogenase
MSKIPDSVIAKKIVFPKAYEVGYETRELKTAMEDNQLLIRTQYSLISPGTELAFYTDTHIARDSWAKLPISPGYNSVGEVVAVGKAVTAVSPGDQVLTFRPHADYDVTMYNPERLIKLPKGLSPKKALFARMADISMSSLIHSRIQAGTHVVVIGMGIVGNLAAQLYAIQGARSIGVDVVEQRLQIANQTGISHTVQSGDNVDLVENVKEITGGHEPDIVVEATGNPALINVALGLVRRRGQVILLGSPRGTAEIDVYRHIHSRGVSLTGAHANIKGFDGLPSSLEIIRYMLELINKGVLSVEPLITHVLRPNQAKEAYDMLLNKKESALGVILDWQSGEEL